MTIAVACPQCHTQFEIASDLADQPVRCHRCLHVFDASATSSTGIQSAPAPLPRDKGLPASSPPPRRPQPRSPFPVFSVLLVIIGLLILFLVLSVGFNVWYILGPEPRAHRMEEVRAMQDQAEAMRMQAERGEAAARQQEMDTQRKWESMKRQNEELQKQLDLLRQRLKEAEEKEKE